MSRVKPETRCKHLARDIRPLANHISKGFSPAVRRISMNRPDWELLHQKPEAARAEGFTIIGDRVTFQGIEVVPRAST
jgi:hypothetical protein